MNQSIRKKLQRSSHLEDYSDGRSFDKGAYNYIKSIWIDDQLLARRDEFTAKKEHKIFCGTYNVNGKKLSSDSSSSSHNNSNLEGTHNNNIDISDVKALSAWLEHNNADIVVVGLQEMVDLNAVNVAMDTKSASRAQYWNQVLDKALNENIPSSESSQKFDFVASKFLVGLFIIVFARHNLIKNMNITDVRTSSLGVGMMGVLGNKGGVCVRLNLYESSFCFICAHLAAHRENVSGRNADIGNIINKTVFNSDPNNSDTINSDGLCEERTHSPIYRQMSEDLSVFDHGNIFFLGDLNFRIEESLSIDEVFTLINQGKLQKLSIHDQLNIEREQRNNELDSFIENDITFKPTYKYQPGTNHYDTRPEKKVRVPAWCDRILFKENDHYEKGSYITQLTYNSVDTPLISDHKPVSAIFLCDVRCMVPDKAKQVFDHVMNSISSSPGQIDAAIPRVEISPNKLIFEEPLRYYERISRTIKLTNTGSCFAVWRFLENMNMEGPSIAKSFVTISPTFGLVLPGQSIELELEVCINKTFSILLQEGDDILDDVLRLHIENGMDYFIHVKAEQKPTCFGMNLSKLVCCKEPISQSITMPNFHNMRVQRLSIPKELWELVNYFHVHPDTIKQPSSFIHNKNDMHDMNSETKQELYKIMDALDDGRPLDALRTDLISHSMFLLVDSFDILPLDRFSNLKDVENLTNDDIAERLYSNLQGPAYNCCVILLAFLKQAYASRNHNMITKNNLRDYLMCLIGRYSVSEGRRVDPDQEDVKELMLVEIALISLIRLIE